jgi:hypothetical protein
VVNGRIKENSVEMFNPPEENDDSILPKLAARYNTNPKVYK